MEKTQGTHKFLTKAYLLNLKMLNMKYNIYETKL